MERKREKERSGRGMEGREKGGKVKRKENGGDMRERKVAEMGRVR